MLANAPYPGDYNVDGVVDAADYTVWRDQLGSTAPAFSGADGDGSGIVDQIDYDLWRANYGVLVATPIPAVSSMQPILSGADWHDVDGNPIEAHEGGIIQEGGTFYLYGTNRSSNNQWFKGVNLYSSTDLVHWEFENTILDYNSHPSLQDRVLERPKILRNPTTGKYAMWWHHESFDYSLAQVGVATSDTIDGDYTFLSSFRPLGNDSRDIGMFQDTDGEAYLLSSISGNSQVGIFRLNDTYTGVEELVYAAGGNFNGEGLSMVKKDGTYFFFKSWHNGWAPNDNTYSTATSLAGPWTYRGSFVPAGTGTFFAQNYNSMVVNGTQGSTVFFMGDRWQPQAQSQSRSIFLPISFSRTTASIVWRDAWTIDAVGGLSSDGEDHLSGVYQIVSRSSGQTLTASGTGNGSVVEQATYTGDATQKWIVTQLGPDKGSYRISNLASQRVLDVSGSSVEDGARVVVYDNYNAKNQQWRISPTDRGYYSVLGVESRKALEIPDGSSVPGEDVTQRGRDGKLWQEWAFIPVDEQDVPAKPTGVVAMNPGVVISPRGDQNRVRLDWTPVPDAAYYQVKRATTIAGPYYSIGAPVVVPSATLATDLDQLYFYRISAVNSFGESEGSAPIGYSAAALRAWYPAEGSTLDSGSGAAHATNNGATFVPGHNGGQALHFNGVNQAVTLPRVVGLDDFTISFWMKTTQTGGAGEWSDGKGIVDANVEGSFADFGVSLLGDKVAFGLGGLGYNAQGVADTTITSNTIVNDGQWRHVTATYNASTGAMMLYLDGALEASADGPRGARTTPQAIRLGAIQSLTTSGYYNGSLDEVRLYEGVLSAGDISDLTSISGTASASFSVANTTYQASNEFGPGVQFNHTGPVASPVVAPFDVAAQPFGPRRARTDELRALDDWFKRASLATLLSEDDEMSAVDQSLHAVDEAYADEYNDEIATGLESALVRQVE